MVITLLITRYKLIECDNDCLIFMVFLCHKYQYGAYCLSSLIKMSIFLFWKFVVLWEFLKLFFTCFSTDIFNLTTGVSNYIHWVMGQDRWAGQWEDHWSMGIIPVILLEYNFLLLWPYTSSVNFVFVCICWFSIRSKRLWQLFKTPLMKIYPGFYHVTSFEM